MTEEGQRGGQLSATLLPEHPPRKNPRGHAAQPPGRHSKQELPGCSQGICSLQKCILFDVLTSECRGISSSAGDAAKLAQEWTALPDPIAKPTCLNPASGTVSELAVPWLQKRRIDGLCWLQQPEGLITQLSQTRIEKVIGGSLSLLPHHASGKNKEASILCRLHPHLRHFLCPQASWEISPALDKYEQPFPHPCHP